MAEAADDIIASKGRPSNTVLLVREGSSQGNKIFQYFKKRGRDTKSSSPENSSPDTKKICAENLTREVDLDKSYTDEGSPCTSVCVQSNQPQPNFLSPEEVNTPITSNNNMADENTQVLLRELQKIRSEIADNAMKMNTQYELINKRLDDQDKAWTLQWSKLSERVNTLEKRHDGLEKFDLANFEDRLVTLESTTSGSKSNSIDECDKAQLARCSTWIEKLDKEARKLNLMVKGLSCTTENVEAEMNAFLELNFALKDKIEQASILSREKNLVKIKMRDWDSKLSILKNKYTKLKGQNIYVDNDLTDTERRINWDIRNYVKLERTRAKGQEAKAGYMKIYLNGIWMQWDKENKRPISSKPRQAQGHTWATDRRSRFPKRDQISEENAETRTKN